MENRAAWLQHKQQNPVVVSSAPFPTPGPNEVVIKNQYAAINPVDWKIQFIHPGAMYTPDAYPNSVGTDVSGVIHSVGSKVTRFKPGDRFIAHCAAHGLSPTKDPKYAGLQLFVTCCADFTSLVPDSIPLENAAVLPLSVSTSAAALFMKTFLGLPPPTTSLKGNLSEKAILIWGASGSVGSSGVQFAKAAGLTVIATSSPRSFDYVKSLGAEQVFDYADVEVAAKVVEYLKTKNLSLDSVFDSISEGGSVEKSFEGGGRYVGVLNVALKLVPAGVQASTVFATRMAEEPEVLKAVWQDFLPAALASGQFLPKPDPILIDGGL